MTIFRFAGQIRRLADIRQKRPYILIGESGQLTEHPRVSVSLYSRTGMQTVYSYDADEVGHAKCSHYAKGLAHITGLPIVDRRGDPK